jgi:hypothetical protein
VFGLSEQTQVIPENYPTFFANRTKPADWQEEPPAWDLLIAQLKEQPIRIREMMKDKLEVSVKENYHKAETVEELIVSSVLHEVNHLGTISAMLKVLK